MKLAKPRDLANRSLGLLSGAVGLVRAVREGVIPGPLWLALRAANELARRIAEQPTPVASAAQRRTLLAAGAQIRAMTAHLIISTEERDPRSVTAELSELVTRTLELIERVTAEPTSIAGQASDVKVIDVTAVEVEREPR
ncbi:MAG: hypothetical protein ABUL62_15070 [Myxococcales bacterium]|jgi:hypothetical protein